MSGQTEPARVTSTDRPLISVVMPCYNGMRTVERSLRSVLAQTHDTLELIVVDDGSRDDSVSVIAAHAARDPRVRLISQENRGPAPARNRGLGAARGEFIAFLDADDTWEPDCLEALLAALLADRDAALAYCGWQNLGITGGRGEPFVPADYELPNKVEIFLSGCRWPIHAALTRAQAIRASGGFDESLKACMDFDLWLRIATAYRIVRVPRVLAYYHHHAATQITRDRVRVASNHLKAQEKFVRTHQAALADLKRDDIRRILYGELLRRAYECYWARDLDAARHLFRMVMKAGYGKARDWKYMLPSVLPRRVHQALLHGLSTGE